MAEKILIIDDDLDTLRLVGLMLQRQGYQIVAASNGTLGLEKAFGEKPDLILLDIMMPDMDGYEVARQLRDNPDTKHTPILMFTAKTQLDDKVAGFEVGADDYLTKPTHPSELQAHVKALLARAGRVPEDSKTALHEHHAYIIGVIAARGGLGVSTLACNLAATLFQELQADVILAELFPGRGSLGLDLGIQDCSGLVELLQLSPGDISRDKVAGVLEPHVAGFKPLLASYQPKDFNLIEQLNQYETLVPRLASMGRFLVMDFGVGLPPFVQRLLPMVNEVLVVLEGVPNTILHTRALIDDLIEMGLNKGHISAVLNNRLRTESQMAWTEVQKQLDHPLAVTFTPAPELFFQAVKMKMPAVLCQPESLTAQQFGKLVETISERESHKK